MSKYGMAKATLFGNLTADPDVKATAGGAKVCNVTLACTERVKRGEKWEDQTEFSRVVVFGNQAENLGKFCKKGDSLLVEGRLQTREWEKEGVKHWTTETVAREVVFTGSKGDHGGGGKSAPF